MVDEPAAGAPDDLAAAAGRVPATDHSEAVAARSVGIYAALMLTRAGGILGDPGVALCESAAG